jgi:hypothetical protein
MTARALILAACTAVAFYGGFRVGHYTRPDLALLERCIKDYEHAADVIDQLLAPAPGPILVPALDDEQEGDIT